MKKHNAIGTRATRMISVCMVMVLILCSGISAFAAEEEESLAEFVDTGSTYVSEEGETDGTIMPETDVSGDTGVPDTGAFQEETDTGVFQEETDTGAFQEETDPVPPAETAGEPAGPDVPQVVDPEEEIDAAGSEEAPAEVDETGFQDVPEEETVAADLEEDPAEDAYDGEGEEAEPAEELLQADTRKEVKTITGTSTGWKEIAKFGDMINSPAITMTSDGYGMDSGAYFNFFNGWWLRLEDGTDESNEMNWKQQFDGGMFTPGKWRFEIQIRIDDPEKIKKYKFANSVSVKINGETWEENEHGYPAGDQYAYIVVHSPSITITQPSGFYFLDSADYDIRYPTVGEYISPIKLSGTVFGSNKLRFIKISDGFDWIKVSENGIISGKPTEASAPGSNSSELWIRVIAEDDPSVWPYSDAERLKDISISVDPVRERVTTVKATSNTASVAVKGKTIQTPFFSVSTGSPAYFKEIQWEKKQADGTWTAASGSFTLGEWRMAGKVVIGNDPSIPDNRYYALRGPLTVQVDGKSWTVTQQPGEIRYGPLGTGAEVVSPVCTITASIGSTTISGIKDTTYTGNAIKQSITVKDGSVTLKEGTDYTVSYKDNVKVGTATVTITGKGYYTGSINKTFKIIAEKIPSVSYRTHVQNIGWQDYVKDGAMSGTEGKSLRLEGINISVSNLPYSGGITYRTHVQNIGWQNYVSDGAMAGTSGKSLRLEGIQIRLTGELAKYYDVYYQTHVQNIGWTGWAMNGEMCGSAGYAYRLEGIRIRLVKKGNAAPGSTAGIFHLKPGSSSEPESRVSGANVGYNTHVQNYGWQNYVYDGAMAGTSGQSLRLEGIHIRLIDKLYSGDIVYRTHVQNVGWQGWKKNGEMSGTSGRSLRLEGIQIYLTGDMAKKYDIYYCVHAQDYGWLGWSKNGVMAGTSGLSKRLEGIRIQLVPKGGSAPAAVGSIAGGYVCGNGTTLPNNPYTGS